MFKVIKNDHFLVFLAAWVLFPKIFGQVKEWFMTELHNIKRLLHLVVLFYERLSGRSVQSYNELSYFSIF